MLINNLTPSELYCSAVLRVEDTYVELQRVDLCTNCDSTSSLITLQPCTF